MPACELVIFDCDGTVMDTEMMMAEVEVEAVAEFGLKMTAQEFNARFAGTSGENVKKALEEELGRSLPDDYEKKVRDKMNERLWREAKIVPGIVEVLDGFDQPRCICSNAGMEKLKIELSKGELWDRFRPFVYSARDLDGVEHKPAPDVFLHAAKEFEVSPKACIVIEDSVTGVTGAKAAGMRVIGFTGGSHTYPGHSDDLTNAGAETVINRLKDIPALIDVMSMWDGLDA